MHRRLTQLTTLAACSALALSACSTKKVDVGSVEKQVVTELKTEFPTVKTVDTKCPPDVKVAKGKSFVCGTSLDGQGTNIKIDILTVKDSKFTFQAKATQPLYESAKLVQRLKAEFTATDATCGSKSVLVKKPGDVIACTYTVGGAARPLNLRVKNAKGELEPVK